MIVMDHKNFKQSDYHNYNKQDKSRITDMLEKGRGDLKISEENLEIQELRQSFAIKFRGLEFRFSDLLAEKNHCEDMLSSKCEEICSLQSKQRILEKSLEEFKQKMQLAFNEGEMLKENLQVEKEKRIKCEKEIENDRMKIKEIIGQYEVVVADNERKTLVCDSQCEKLRELESENFKLKTRIEKLELAELESKSSKVNFETKKFKDGLDIKPSISLEELKVEYEKLMGDYVGLSEENERQAAVIHSQESELGALREAAKEDMRVMTDAKFKLHDRLEEREETIRLLLNANPEGRARKKKKKSFLPKFLKK